MTTPIYVIKHNGERVAFSPQKLQESLAKSGATDQVVIEVMKEVVANVTDGTTTQKIYQQAHRLLKKVAVVHASRYKLKQAILELGPSGYPFEHFTAELFKALGYKVQTSTIVKGQCVNHEVDVIADNGKERLMIECKFHNRPGYKSDVKIPLYIHSRFNDVAQSWQKDHAHDHKKMQGWIVTNSRFTTDALDYGRCAGLQLLGWDYPDTRNLKSLIESLHLQPITTLSSLTKNEKEQLFSHGIVLCRGLNQQLETAEKILGKRASKILKEADYICNYRP